MKVAVGISGGVDSAVAALLLKERGDEVVGVTMALGRRDEEQTLAEARAIAGRLGIPLHICDLASVWRGKVLDYLRTTYLSGLTPNPCVRCNETVKLGLLPAFAFETLGCDSFATGHYARLEHRADGRVALLRGRDTAKDQSYFLYRVTLDVLSRTIFPLGDMTKAEVRAYACQAGLTLADKDDSQDFCGGDPMAIVAEPPREGNIVTSDGRVLGRHAGFWNYTVGKRKGLGIGGGVPYYVIGLNAVRNEVVVGRKEASVARSFTFEGDCWLDAETVRRGAGLCVKVRSAGEPHGPVVLEGTRCICEEGLMGVAPGQSAVFYAGDQVVGGGIIRK